MFKALKLIIGNFVALLWLVHWLYRIPRPLGCRKGLVDHLGPNG